MRAQRVARSRVRLIVAHRNLHAQHPSC
jgi:hypothetical protein